MPRIATLGLLVLVLALAMPALAADRGTQVRTSQSAVVIDVRFAPPELNERGDGTVLASLPALRSRAARPGAPLLPEKPLTVLLPPGTRVAGVRIEGVAQTLRSTLRLAWGQPPVPIGHEALAAIPADPKVYQSDALYPDRAAQVVRTGRYRGFTVATVVLAPVQVRPRQGQLLAWSRMSVTLELERDPAALASTPRGLVEDAIALAKLVANPDAASLYAAPAAKNASEPYLIVCADSLCASFERLLAHRATHGMAGRMLSVSAIEAAYSGPDTPAKIREAIREAYTMRGTTHALLAGDDVGNGGETLVPYRGCLLDAGGYRYTDAPVDFYFGALDGSWNTDGDSVWCEPDEIDYFSEVHIGRATVDTPQEADRFIDKVLAYEAGLAADRQRDLVWIGESLDASTWGGDSKDVTAALVPADEFEISRLYDREGTFSRQNVIAALNRGPHLTNHLGHANSSYVMGIYSSDVDALVNESPFFSYTQGCDAGAFDQSFSGSSEAVSEHFVLAEHAAFGIVANVRYGWYSPGATNGPSQYFDHEFYDALFTENLDTLGAANDDARHDNAALSQGDEYLRWCFLETNLHGDPATPMAVGRRFRVNATRVVDLDPLHGNANGMADPGEVLRLAVTVENTRGEDAAGVEGRLSSALAGVVIHDPYAAWGFLAAHAAQENAPPHFTFEADVPCGTFVPFQLEILDASGETESLSFTVLMGERTERVLFEDDFEADQGWAHSGSCSDGAWERGEPRGTLNGAEPANPDADASPDPGTLAFVTGNAGLSATDDDVDHGTALLASPALDASGYLDLRVSYQRWYYISPYTTPPSNSLRVEASGDDGGTWVELERVVSTATPWAAKTFPLESAIPLDTVRLRVVAEEMAMGTRDVIIEAGLDDVRFEGTWTRCQGFVPPALSPPAPVGATLTATRAGEHVMLAWVAPSEDPAHGPATFYRVERAALHGAEWLPLGEPLAEQWMDCGACADGISYQYLVTAANGAGPEIP